MTGGQAVTVHYWQDSDWAVGDHGAQGTFLPGGDIKCNVMGEGGGIAMCSGSWENFLTKGAAARNFLRGEAASCDWAYDDMQKKMDSKGS